MPLPIAAIREGLRRAAPGWQWRCGDDDSGSAQDVGGFDRPQTVLGRGLGGMVIMGIELHLAPLPLESGAPPHRLHLKLSQPSTEDSQLAKRMAVVVCASLMVDHDPAAHCQLAPGGRWYSTEDMRAGLATCTAATGAEHDVDDFLLRYGSAGASAADAGAAPPSPLAPSRPSPAEALLLSSDVGLSFAKILSEVAGPDMARDLGYAPPPAYAEEKPRRDRLPTMVLALTGPIQFDWSQIADTIDQWDAEGNWRFECAPDGTGAIHGRGGVTRLAFAAEPVPRYSIENALARSFWFEGGLPQFANGRAQLVVGCELDTATAPFEDIRETAKLLTLVIGLLARSPQTIAVLNAGVGTLLSPELVQSQVGHLHKNEIPLMLWTWTAPESMVENAVSLTSGGLLPFLGYEVEVWNAPGSASWVADKMSHILNYLLHHGPIVSDGNSFGESKGDRSIRGFFGPSRAQRGPEPVNALLLEFDQPGAVRPRPDALPPAAEAPRRAAGGFGRKGL
ncbi:DUF4261 domain-containing protein [Sphingomonas sp.]|uniref:DUF4261 domain-containing protein n=1 Tax=Sphingomonas sp. TaxID=28214 RepID=UPI00286DD3B2|nr:DUF4261 domain-containing protein [Sphingomonas sp.]